MLPARSVLPCAALLAASIIIASGGGAELLEMTHVPAVGCCSTLPDGWSRALHEYHVCAAAEKEARAHGGGAGGKGWSLDEDACILHQRHGPERVAWPKVVVPGRSWRAAKEHYNTYLKPKLVDKLESKAWGAGTAEAPANASARARDRAIDARALAAQPPRLMGGTALAARGRIDAQPPARATAHTTCLPPAISSAGVVLALAAAHAPSAHRPEMDTDIDTISACSLAPATASCSECWPSDDAAPFEARLHACINASGVELPAHVRSSLVAVHMLQQNVSNAPKDPWGIEEDARILATRIAREPLSQIKLARRTKDAVRQRWTRLRAKLPNAMCTFGLALSDQEAPELQLHHDTWTPITADRALPRNAEVDWLRGVARAPASWEMHLDGSRFCLYDEAARRPMCADASDAFVLEDMRPDMTIRTVLGHVANWMQSSASPTLAQGVDREKLRLAILPEGTMPPPASSTLMTYAQGDRVQYRCRDGQIRAATVCAVNARAKPQRYTIAIDVDERCVPATSLSATKPHVPSSQPGSTAAMPSAERAPAQFEVGQRVWYRVHEFDMQASERCAEVDASDSDSAFELGTPNARQPAPPAPRRARIVTPDIDGEYVVTLEGDERETTSLQLAPMPAPDASAPSEPPPQQAPVPIDLTRPDGVDTTVAHADLFNKTARIVIVTADVQDYWERWCARARTCACIALPHLGSRRLAPARLATPRATSRPGASSLEFPRTIVPRRRQVKDPAHNPRARAPEHVGLVNNLSATDHTQHANETHLGTVTEWDKLTTHLQHAAAPLTRCCFQCGMLNYPTPGDTIRVTNVARKEDCRAFRVFR